MSTNSFVGVLHEDGDTYQARFALFDGDPDTMPYVIAAVWWHTFGCDSTATVTALLAHNWEQVSADIVAGTRPSMPGYQPIPGVGMAMPAAQSAPEPVTGRLTEPAPDHGVEWMYLIDRTTPGRLAICHHGRRWTIRHHLDLTVGRDFIVG